MCALIFMIGVSGLLFLVFPPAGLILFILVIIGHFVKFGKKKEPKQMESNRDKHQRDKAFDKGFDAGYATALKDNDIH